MKLFFLFTVASSFIPALQSVSIPKQPESVHLSISSSKEFKSVQSFIAQAEQLRARYGLQSNRFKRSTSSIDYSSFATFTASISVGEPPQIFNIILDTGSSDLVLAGPKCTTCLATTPKYTASLSSTSQLLNRNNSITYGTGYIFGGLVNDKVSLGNFSYPAQVLTECSNMTSITTNTTSGILGMGLGSSTFSDSYPLLQVLSLGGYLNEQVFAFYLESPYTLNYTTDVPAGVLSIGSTNSSYYEGKINYVPVSNSYDVWQIPLEAVTIGGKDLGISSPYAVIDTGTAGIAGPVAAIDAIYANILGSERIIYNGEPGFWTYPCNATINVSLKFGNILYPIPSPNFNFTEVGSPGTCLGVFFSFQKYGFNERWIIGEPFLTSVYSAFRFYPPAIGFATPKRPVSLNSTTPISTTSANSQATQILPSIFNFSSFLLLTLSSAFVFIVV